MNQRNELGTNGHRYLAYLQTVAGSPSVLRPIDVPRLFDALNMPPSIAMARRDFALWLLDESLTPRTRAAVAAIAKVEGGGM